MKPDFNFDVDLKNFDLTVKTRAFNTRYINPPKSQDIPEHKLKYAYAADLARDMVISKTGRVFVILAGSFIFGDFIEALCVEKNLHIKEMTISTLSLSQNNVDSLSNLLTGGFVDNLNLIVSDYFFSHERQGLIPYLYEKLDFDDRFQLAVAGTHCKTCIFETHSGLKVVMHGSANLRSSACLEQLAIEIDADLYDFNKEYQDSILKTYLTIKKPLRVQKLWQAVQKFSHPTTKE